eukprot:363309-Chlamydomonas_euryale.AAC.2
MVVGPAPSSGSLKLCSWTVSRPATLILHGPAVVPNRACLACTDKPSALARQNAQSCARRLRSERRPSLRLT